MGVVRWPVHCQRIMRTAFVLLAFVTQAASSVPRTIPEKVIDLDAAPSERWQASVHEVVTKYGFEGSFGPLLDYIDSLNEKTWTLVELVASELEKHVPSEYAEEMRGVANTARDMGYGKELPLSTIVGVNLLYEFSTFCTSIVCVDASNRIWHARNLDWSFDGDSMRNITIVANFHKGGVSVFKTITWVGYIGAMTGMRHGAFSVTADERKPSDGIFSVGIALERMIFQHSRSVGFLMRDVLSTNATYGDALKTLAGAPLASSVYFILGGLTGNEGAVITRKEFSVDVWSIPNGPEPWFVLETNYDHNTNAPPQDDRRDLGISAMRKMGQAGISASNLMGVLGTPAANGSRGVFNSETVYSVIMNSGQDYFNGSTWQ